MAAGLPTAAFAQTSPQTATLNVSATVTAVCNVAAAGAGTIAFGNVQAGSTANASGAVTVTCNKGAIVQATAASGNASGSQKRMRLGATSDYLDYTVWQPDITALGGCAATQTDWTGSVALTNLWNAAGGPKTIPVCATTSPTTTNNSGTYTDTLTISVSFS